MKFRLYSLKEDKYITEPDIIDVIYKKFEELSDKEDILFISTSGPEKEPEPEEDKEDKWGFTAGVGGYE